MKLGISTAAYYGRLETEEAAALLATMGIDCCEAFLECASEYEPDFIADLRGRLAGLPVHSIHPKGTQYEDGFFGKSPRQREDALRMFERVLTAGELLGAKVYVFHGMPDIHRRNLGPNMRLHAGIVREACARAAAHGIAFAWENVWWCQLARPEHVAAVREAVPEARFVLDIKQAMHAGFDPLDFLREMQGALVNVHLCDADAQGKLCLPGRGVYDFAALFAALRGAGYDDCVMLEPYGDMFTEQAEMEAAVSVLQKAIVPRRTNK